MAASTPRVHGSRFAVLATDDEGDSAGVRVVVTVWTGTGVDVSIPLLPEGVSRTDSDPASSFLRGIGSRPYSKFCLASLH